MALETGTYISDLVATNPTSTDPKSEGDNHIRLVKSTIQATFPNVTGAVTPTQDQFNVLSAGQFAGLRNKIINGKMEVSQRGTSFAAIADNAYCVDRWYVGYITAAVLTASQQADAPSDNEFYSSLRLTVTTADASIAATDYAALVQPIEGRNARDLIGRNLTLSFWARSSKTGVHCVSLRNAGKDRSYVAEYSISVANTWERKTVSVPAGLITAGTWDWQNGVGLYVSFALAAGASLQTTAGAWQTGNFFATSSQVNCLDTIGNIFAVTGVQLEVSSAATPFEHRPYGLELALCQRYYYRVSIFVGYPGFGILSNQARFSIPFPATMRVIPSALEQSGTATQYIVVRNTGATVTSNAVPTFIGASEAAAQIRLDFASGITAGEGLQAAGSVGSYLGFSVEL